MRRTILNHNSIGNNVITLLDNTTGLIVPSVQARNIIISNVVTFGMKLSWTNGTKGTGRVLIIRTNNLWDDTDNFIMNCNNYYLLANNGDYINAVILPNMNGGNSHIVANIEGSNRYCNVMNLSADTEYYFKVYEYVHNSVGIIYRSDNGTNLNPRGRRTHISII